jgi:hypothetical protein
MNIFPYFHLRKEGIRILGRSTFGDSPEYLSTCMTGEGIALQFRG